MLYNKRLLSILGYFPRHAEPFFTSQTNSRQSALEALCFCPHPPLRAPGSNSGTSTLYVLIDHDLYLSSVPKLTVRNNNGFIRGCCRYPKCTLTCTAFARHLIHEDQVDCFA